MSYLLQEGAQSLVRTPAEVGVETVIVNLVLWLKLAVGYYGRHNHRAGVFSTIYHLALACLAVYYFTLVRPGGGAKPTSAPLRRAGWLTILRPMSIDKVATLGRTLLFKELDAELRRSRRVSARSAKYSRARSPRLQQDGLVPLDGRRLSIPDEAALASYAGED